MQSQASHVVRSGDSLPSSRQLRISIASKNLSMARVEKAQAHEGGRHHQRLSSEGVTGGGRAEGRVLVSPWNAGGGDMN